MKYVECADYAECSKKHNLTIKRKHCPMAKVEYVQTNADRIRAMSDEELAEFLCGVYDDDTCGVYQDECGKFINGTIIIDYDENAILEWLKQPAEE